MTGSTNNACAVTLVYHYKGFVFLCQITNLVHGGNVAVHGEHAVCYNDSVTAALGFLELGLKVCHIGICVTETLGLAKTNAVYD